MALTFPRNLPNQKLIGITFDLEVQETQTPVGGGEIMGAQLGPSRWAFKARTETLDPATAQEWEAFAISLRGVGRTFYGRHPGRSYPLIYRHTGWDDLTRHSGGSLDADGSCSWSVNGDRDVMTLGTSLKLPSTFKLKTGDYIGLKWDSTKRSLHKALESATAVNGVLSINVEPIIDPRCVPDAATCYLHNANAVFVNRKPTPPDQNFQSVGYSFDAIQHIEP